ncbi:MAG: penicillin acylase family protein [Desulfosalsimonas sp.]
MKKWLLIGGTVLGLLILVIAVAAVFIIKSNTYKTNEDIRTAGIKKDVRIYRDEKAMAYIYAQNIHDAFFAMGFATAQDRLFQLEITKRFALGRISEIIGQSGKTSDIRMRTLGFHIHAQKHASILSDRTMQILQRYIDGINKFIEHHKNQHHLEFTLAGIEPEPWDITDSLALLYYMGWNSAGNLDCEIIAQMLTEKLGAEKASQIFPLNIFPGKEPTHSAANRQDIKQAGIDPLELIQDSTLLSFMKTDRSLAAGSNNWAVSGKLSESGKPVVANDPHLDARIMPGPWYPCALILPEKRIVGATIPGIPAMVVGRNNHVAFGITNSYGDAQDLYIETLDPQNPEHYMEKDRSIPFEKRFETIKIKDNDAPGGLRKEEVLIRATKRGPVVSGILKGLETDKVLTMRWSPFESMTPVLGMEDLMLAESTDDLKTAIAGITTIMLNFVFADIDGNIGWQTSGQLPVRIQGESTVPYKVENSTDNWTGWIPFSAMPHEYNPEKQWVGTCNHKTVSNDYPYYISSLFAPPYRYHRLAQLMEANGKLTVDDHWAFQRDIKNPMAEKIAPVMAEILASRSDTEKMAKILSNWDYTENKDSAAATVFHTVFREFLYQTFSDELGETFMDAFADTDYFWKERLEKMVLAGNSPWFDDITTSQRETMQDIFYRAAVSAKSGLEEQLGKDPEKWHWGEMHKLEFVSPVMRSGFLKEIFGGGRHPMAGSAETLYRAIYSYSSPFDVTVPASLRMVADLGDPDKVVAVLPCGITGRQFHKHGKDQTEAFMSGEKRYWWFSDEMIEKHAQSQLVLTAQN